MTNCPMANENSDARGTVTIQIGMTTAVMRYMMGTSRASPSVPSSWPVYAERKSTRCASRFVTAQEMLSGA